MVGTPDVNPQEWQHTPAEQSVCVHMAVDQEIGRPHTSEKLPLATRRDAGNEPVLRASEDRFVGW